MKTRTWVGRGAGALGWCFFAALGLAQSGDGTALVRHAPTLNGRVEGSVRQMTAENATLNGGAAVTGDLFVPGTPTVRLNGQPDYAGTLDGTTARAQLEAQVKIVADLRREIQYAADVLWPVAPANAGARQAFALPPDKALR